MIQHYSKTTTRLGWEAGPVTTLNSNMLTRKQQLRFNSFFNMNFVFQIT
jgi:hypothetical protein